MRKRTSLRRWKARTKIGKAIPRWAIENYSLTRWFIFDTINDYSEFYRGRFWRNLKRS